MNDTGSLILRISEASGRYGDRLLDFMERYHLNGLMEAQEWQLREYIQTEGLNYAETQEKAIPRKA